MSTREECLAYIERFWNETLVHETEDKGIRIGLPHAFIPPNNTEQFLGDQFYWDSYFTILGLVVAGREELASGMIKNLNYLYKRFGIIPSRNRTYNTGISQPPFLTSMLWEVYNKTKNEELAKETMRVAEEELNNYWMNKEHQVYHELSRYADQFETHGTAEHESGWDMTTRFEGQALDIIPIDLNSLLYKYEVDLAALHRHFGDELTAQRLDAQANKRKTRMNKLFWKENCFYDYNFQTHEQLTHKTTAMFYPLWSGWADEDQAKKIVEQLPALERAGGLTNTEENCHELPQKQWDFPNGWPGQQWIAIIGLLNYGYKEDAKRLAKKWIDMNEHVYNNTKAFWEKYDVVRGEQGSDGRYKTPKGFGWSCAIYLRLNKLLEEL